MKRALLKRNQSGFTIIEVMIVLLVAGVILLMVFLAIPALQRNNRNTQARNDVASTLSFIGEYSTNNNGAMPLAVCTPTTNGDIYISADAACSAGDPLSGKIRGGITVVGNNTVAMPTTTGVVNVRLGFGCNGPALGLAKARASAALFLVETAGGTTPQCQES